VMSAGGVLLLLLCVWGLLAAVYCFPVWLMGLFANRALTWRRCWRLAGAALMPGAVFFTGAIALYGLGALDLVKLAAAAVVHLVFTWVYLPLGVWRSPRLEPEVPAGNPFTPLS
jgi:hypothetical protein